MTKRLPLVEYHQYMMNQVIDDIKKDVREIANFDSNMAYTVAQETKIEMLMYLIKNLNHVVGTNDTL